MKRQATYISLATATFTAAIWACTPYSTAQVVHANAESTLTGHCYSTDEKFSCYVDSDTLYITGYNTDKISGTVTIPAEISVGTITYPVHGLMSYPDGYNNLGINSTDLTTLIIEAENAVICEGTFQDNTTLKEVVLSGNGSISEIGVNAFSGDTVLEKIDLNGVTSIGPEAFSGCKALTTISLRSTLKSVGTSAFADCTGLETVFLPAGFHISDSMFSGCTSLKNVYMEGCELVIVSDGLKTEITSCRDIGAKAFYGCTSLENLTIPEGVYFINDDAFSGCTNLQTLSIPSTANFEYTDNSIIDNCNSLTSVKYYGDMNFKLANYVLSLNQSDGKKEEATFYVTDPEVYSGQLPDLKTDYHFSFTETTSEETGETTTTVSGADGLKDLFAAMSNGHEDYNVEISDTIRFDETSLDLETLTADNIFAYVDKLPTISQYNGTMNASPIENMTMRSSGFFGAIGKTAHINNLTFSNAQIYVDPTDSKYKSDAENVYIPILADTINGTVSNFSFDGSMIVDEDRASGKDIVICLANAAGDNAEINGFIHLGDLQTAGDGDNKRCIIIKQNLGLRSSTGSTKGKVATSKSMSSGKSLEADDLDYFEERAFTDEEFANGEVAYWLNYSGKGYTGNYTARWSQGKTVPICATTKDGKSNALYKVNYGGTDMSKISGPTYANEGSTITVTYGQQPTALTVGNEDHTFGATSVEIEFDPTKAIVFSFPTSESALEETEIENTQVKVTGNTISFFGATGERKDLFALSGTLIASTSTDKVTAPAKGIYVLRIGDKAYKIRVK